MSASGTGELSRLVHRYGGVPVGSFQPFAQAVPKLTAVLPNSVMMDATHDNETPAQKVVVHPVPATMDAPAAATVDPI